MSMTPEQYNELRQRILNGQPYTREELREAIISLRGEFTMSQEKSAAKPKRTPKEKAAPIDLDESLRAAGLDF